MAFPSELFESLLISSYLLSFIPVALQLSMLAVMWPSDPNSRPQIASTFNLTKNTHFRQEIYHRSLSFSLLNW